MVMALTKCIARPPESGKTFPLTDHLLTVGQGMGSHEGGWKERLAFLAGLLHDAGQARLPWQRYIRSNNFAKGSVPHSVYGAVLFAYSADYLFKHMSIPAESEATFQWEVMRWVRDIMDHHGQLKDITETSLPWEGHFFAEELGEMDLAGFHRFVSKYFPELSDLNFSVNDIKVWQRAFKKTWRSWYRIHIRKHAKREGATNQCIRTSTAQLIQADRFDAALLEKRSMKNDEINEALNCLNQHIERLASGATPKEKKSISDLRQYYQQAAVSQYKEQKGERIFILKLPTGMGKTMTALKVALTACLVTDKQRIVYVAPYLSILSQATTELRNATGLEVQQHHSLTWSENREWDDKAVLLLESWQAPIVTTSFNQLFRGLFPSRAQETLRLAGLQNAVLILDEPQIVSQAVWIPFLKMLETAVEILDMQVVFVSATMPPLNVLDLQPISLVTENIVYPPRYCVKKIHTPHSEDDIASILAERINRDQHLAVILNTIEDSSRVFSLVREHLGQRQDELNVELIHLNGAMTPLHKSVLIQKVKKRLADKTEHNRLLVVSTQIIEAGVDISFNTVFRALPIYPSLVQAAGRINRHAEGEKGELIVFPFYRQGEKDTRKSVYQERLFREETDYALAKQDSWSEIDFIREVDGYYDSVFERMQPEASLQKVVEAAKGNWMELAKLSPFEEGQQRVSVFVPWGETFLGLNDVQLTQEEMTIKNGILRLMRQFEVESIEEIYERYEDSIWMSQLTFVERKQFMGLLQQFIVPINLKTAMGVVANLRDEKAIKRITSLDEYSDTSGLAHHIGNEDDGVIW